MTVRWAKEYPTLQARLEAFLKVAKCNADSPWGTSCGECPLKRLDGHILQCGMEVITEWLKVDGDD